MGKKSTAYTVFAVLTVGAAVALIGAGFMFTSTSSPSHSITPGKAAPVKPGPPVFGMTLVDNATVAKTDIRATNGVIHVIDAVILPKN